MDVISSRNNEKIIQTAKLKEKKYRDIRRLFIAEGIKLCREALACGADISETFVSESFISAHPDETVAGNRIIVSDSVFDKLSSEKSPEGILCTTAYRFKTELFSEAPEPALPCFILCSVRDPGNVGTIIRSSYALGIRTLILSSDCADIYNPKAVRGSMGAVFKQNIVVSDDIKKDIGALKEKGISVIAAVLDESAHCLNSTEVNDRICFAVGNEGMGLPKDITDICSGKVYIPMEAGAESLNASVAASILMWEQYKNGR